MRFVRIPLTDLARRPVRSVLTAAGVAVAIAGYVMLTGLATGLERAWIDNFNVRGTDVLGVRKGAVEILATSIDAETVADVRQVDGVAEADGELADIVALDTGETVVVCGWRPGGYLWRSVRMSQGRLPREGVDEVVVGRVMADALGKGPGDDITLLDRPMRVVGVAVADSTMAGGAVIMALDSMQALLNREGQVTAVHVRVRRTADDPGSLERTVGRLGRRFPDLSFTPTAALADQNHVVGLLRAVARVMSAIGLVLAVVVVVNTLLMSVTERTREIGMLGAIGWSRERVVRAIAIEAIAVTAPGGAVGVALGALASRWMATHTVLRGFVQPDVSWSVMATSLVLAVLLGLAAALYPAWRAASTDAASALRYQ